MAEDDAWINTERTSDALVVAVGGDWRVDAVANLLRAAAATWTAEKAGDGVSTAVVRARDISFLDSAGAWLLVHLSRQLEERGFATRIDGLGDSHRLLLDRVRKSADRIEITEVPPNQSALVSALATVGEAAVNACKRAHELLSFFGLTVILLGRVIVRPWRLEVTATLKYIERTGLDALPIVGLLAFLIGVVVAFMGATQLKQFGAEIFTVNLVGVAVLRELGVLITSILIAGRSGSAFTAQIGTMKVNQEVDAMQTIGLDPVEILVLPRIIALMITLPLLTFYANMMGLAGGAFMSVVTLDITLTQFLDQLSGAIDFTTFAIGMVKAPVFAYVIALVGCFEGLKVTGSAESVGQRTTMSVVEGIFLVIVFDSIFAIAFSYLGI
jgi:phospholipid/cholesterol/gamma-HCH transport system permease protein